MFQDKMQEQEGLSLALPAGRGAVQMLLLWGTLEISSQSQPWVLLKGRSWV